MPALYADSETKRIIDYLEENGPATRHQIADALGKTKMAVRECMRQSPHFRIVGTHNVGYYGGVEHLWDAMLVVGQRVTWTHTNPLGHQWGLTGTIIGGD